MAALTDTDLTQLSTEAAETFADNYYAVLNNGRAQIHSFYVPKQEPAKGRAVPYISYNGAVLNDAAELEARFIKDMPYTFYEPQMVNVHVMSPSITGGEAKTKREAERNVSLTVQVSGTVRLLERKDGPKRGFSESFVLVPNTEETAGKGAAKQEAGRKWLIHSQNFRFVV